MSTDKRLTEWEAGQELIKAYDCLGEVRVELKNGGFPECSETVRQSQNFIAKVFNELNSHEFHLSEVAP